MNFSKAALGASIFLAWSFGAGISPVQAGAASTSVTVRAVVLPIAAVKTAFEPATLTITEEDVRKGFVDASSPSLIELRSNSRRGCILVLQTGDSPFKEAEVTFLGRTVVVGRQGGMLVFPVFGRQIVSMRYRFLLSHDARPGAYPWPFSLSIAPPE
jgi:hypothetical protein